MTRVVRGNYPQVDFLISSVKRFSLKAYGRVNLLKEMYPEIPLPSQPLVTIRDTLVAAAEYFVKHIVIIKKFCGPWSLNSNRGNS